MNMIVDLRSDTVTKPTKEMLQAMFAAEVGDEVFEEDPTVNQLEAKAASMFGHEDAIFCASGTMTNQIAIRLLTQPQDEVICDQTAHIYRYEGGGIASNSGASVRLLNGDRGIFTPKDVTDNINPDNEHYPVTRMVAIENTSNRGGGSFFTFGQMKELQQVCKEKNLFYHIDGARIFNALVETGDDPEEVGKLFDTVSICLSKGLGAPVGSLLIGSKEKIRKARKIRKAFGGGWRQAGYLAAAGIYALDHHISRLKEDHRRAKEIGKTLTALPFIETVLPVVTNIVILRLKREVVAADFQSYLSRNGIKCNITAPQTIRMVTHLDITDVMIQKTSETIKKFSGAVIA